MKLKKMCRLPVLCMAAVLAGISLFACQTLPNLSGAGRVVPPEKRISFPHGGTYRGHWATRDLTLTYQYEQAGNSFTIAGTVDFAESLRTGFRTLDYFFLGIVLVDDAGTVQASVPLLTVGHGRSIENKFTFKRNITLPSDAVAMAFSFRGRAREGGNSRLDSSNGGIDWNFQEIPY